MGYEGECGIDRAECREEKVKLRADIASLEIQVVEEKKLYASNDVYLRGQILALQEDKEALIQQRDRAHAAADSQEKDLDSANRQNGELKAALENIIKAAKESRYDPRLKGHLRVDDIVEADLILEKYTQKPKCACACHEDPSQAQQCCGCVEKPKRESIREVAERLGIKITGRIESLDGEVAPGPYPEDVEKRSEQSQNYNDLGVETDKD